MDPSTSTELYVPTFLPLPPVHSCSSPSAQAAHSPQELTRQPTPTRSPAVNPVTAAPTASTTPEISWPTASGKCASPHSLRIVWMSLWQIPAARMSMRTSRGPTSRRSRSATRNGWSGPVFCSALTVIVTVPPVGTDRTVPVCQRGRSDSDPRRRPALRGVGAENHSHPRHPHAPRGEYFG